MIDWNNIDGYREDMSADEKLALLDNYTPPTTEPARPAQTETTSAGNPADSATSAASSVAEDKAARMMADVALKRTNDKLASENASLKRQLRAKMSEEEAREADRKAEMEARDAELEALRKDKTISNYRASFLARNYDDTLAQKAAEALANGDVDAVFDYMTQRDVAYEKALRAKILAETPKPPAGLDPNSEEAKKQDQEKLRRYFGLSH